MTKATFLIGVGGSKRAQNSTFSVQVNGNVVLPPGTSDEIAAHSNSTAVAQTLQNALQTRPAFTAILKGSLVLLFASLFALLM
jgi:hypothetical protein